MRLSAISKLLICVAVSAIVSGFSYAHYRYLAQEEAKYDTKVIIHKVVVQEGDTFEGIIGRYYSDNMKPWEPWDAWRHRQRSINKKLFTHGDGSHRWLQPNDTVYVEQKVRVLKNGHS